MFFFWKCPFSAASVQEEAAKAIDAAHPPLHNSYTLHQERDTVPPPRPPNLQTSPLPHLLHLGFHTWSTQSPSYSSRGGQQENWSRQLSIPSPNVLRNFRLYFQFNPWLRKFIYCSVFSSSISPSELWEWYLSSTWGLTMNLLTFEILGWKVLLFLSTKGDSLVKSLSW